MIELKKLALASAILAASSSAMALQAMDEESLSATTGQDGLTITIDSSDIDDMTLTWIDRSGISGGTYTNPGAVVVSNLGVALSNLSITVDAGSAGAADGQLAIGISTPDNITVYLNDRGDVATSTPAAGAVVGVTSAGGIGTGNSANATVVPILKFADNAQMVISGGLAADIKLGNRNTGAGEHFMSLDFNAPVNITLNGLSILDSVGTAANATTALPAGDGDDVGIGIGTLSINGLDVSADVDVVAGGLRINTAGTTIGSIGLERVKLGDLGASSASIGDIYVSGITANSTITITGH